MTSGTATALNLARGYVRNSVAMAQTMMEKARTAEEAAAYQGASGILAKLLTALEKPSGMIPPGKTSVYTTELECQWVFEGEIEPFQPGQFSGPPESCFPDEGGYATLSSGTLGCKTFDHVELLAVFSEDDIEAIEADLYDAWVENQNDQPDYEAGC